MKLRGWLKLLAIILDKAADLMDDGKLNESNAPKTEFEHLENHFNNQN